jgi:hypothetical protein
MVVIECLHEKALKYIKLANQIDEKIEMLRGFSQQWDALQNFQKKQAQDQEIKKWEEKKQGVKNLYFKQLKTILSYE